MSGFKHFFSPLIIDTPLLQVRGIGIREKMPACRIVRPQGTNDYLFMLFHDPVMLMAGGELRPAPSGSLILWPPGSEHDYGSLQGEWRHSWIHCQGERLVAAVHASGLPLGRILTHPDPGRWVMQLEAVYSEIIGACPDAMIVGNLLENSLRDTARLRAFDSQSSEFPVPPALQALRQRLERAPHQPVRLDDLARAAHLSVPHFSALWRRCFGVSPIEDVIRMRIELAKHLLLDRNRRVAEVGRSVGIDDPYRFSKLFRQRVGISPRAYRESQATCISGSVPVNIS
jgi:AraC family transcriptional regulator of arabinose operon